MKQLFPLILALVFALSAFSALAEEVADDEPFMTGTVVDATMNVYVIEDEFGDRYEFSKNDETDFSSLSNGIVLGMKVIATYSGTIDWDSHDASGVKLLALSDAAGSISRAGAIEVLTYVEGEAEVAVLERYVNQTAWAAWYDRDTFAVLSTRDYPSGIVTFKPLDEGAIEGVSLQVYLGGADVKAILGDAYPENAPEDAFTADTDALHFEVKMLTDGETKVTAVLSCPAEAVEGYGERLRQILNSISLLDEKGLSEVCLYLPNEDASALVATPAKVQDDPQGIIDALCAHGALSSDITVNSFRIEDDLGTLDLDFSFGAIMQNTGTAGEAMYMGSVVNTFIARYGLASLTVTCEGATIETGHAVYDEPMAFFGER